MSRATSAKATAKKAPAPSKSKKSSKQTPKKSPKKKSPEKKSPKRRRWIVFGILVMLLVGGYVGRRWVRKALRWTERRYFAHIGDKGPLQRTQAGRWEAHGPGLWTRTMLFKRKRHWSRVRLRIMRVDLAMHKLSLWWQRKPRPIDWVVKKTSAIAAINGGLFDPQYRPLGYFKSQGKVITKRIHKRSIDGVLFVREGKLQVAAAKGWRPKGATLAFQSAPLLVAEGKRLPLRRRSWKVDRRSALCLDRAGKLLLMATDGFINGLSFYELGLLMAATEARGGLGCMWGLNLDGGSSSQWAVRSPKTKQILRTTGIAIPLFLLFHPRAKGAP